MAEADGVEVVIAAQISSEVVVAVVFVRLNRITVESKFDRKSWNDRDGVESSGRVECVGQACLTAVFRFSSAVVRNEERRFTGNHVQIGGVSRRLESNRRILSSTNAFTAIFNTFPRTGGRDVLFNVFRETSDQHDCQRSPIAGYLSFVSRRSVSFDVLLFTSISKPELSKLFPRFKF